MNDMKKILYIRRTPTTKIDGTVRYCDALHDMFANDDTLKACHIENYPTNKSLFFHYSYKKKPLADAIRQADIIHINGYTAMGTVQAFLLAKRYKKKLYIPPTGTHSACCRIRLLANCSSTFSCVA